MRYETRLTLRRPPWFIRAYQHLRNPHGYWPTASTTPWWEHWYAVLIPYQWRAAHRRYAQRHHLFWLPCPLCGQPFGGHEWRPVAGRPDSVPDPTTPGARFGICPRCTKAGRGIDSTGQDRP